MPPRSSRALAVLAAACLALSAPASRAETLFAPAEPVGTRLAPAAPTGSVVALVEPAAPALAPVPTSHLLTRSDAWLGAGAAAAVAIAGGFDHSAYRVSSGPDDPRLHDLARGVRPLGSPVLLAPSVVAGYLAGRLLDRPELSRASVRTALAIGAAGVACEGLKLSVGRMRPRQAPGDPDEYRPFSGDASFPSGHTTVAFAAATALDRETDARWVPMLAYPLAALVGWSRVEDQEHWVSDVVAGAALGWWTADKTETFLRQRGARFGTRSSTVRWFFAPRAHGSRLGVRVRF